MILKLAKTLNLFAVIAILTMLSACGKPKLAVNPESSQNSNSNSDPKQVADLGTTWDEQTGYTPEEDSTYRAVLQPYNWMEAEDLDARRYGMTHAEHFMTTAAIRTGAVIRTPPIHLYSSFDDVEAQTSEGSNALGIGLMPTWMLA